MGVVNIGGCEYITGKCTTYTIRHNVTRPRERSKWREGGREWKQVGEKE